MKIFPVQRLQTLHVSGERKKGLPEPGKVQKEHGQKDPQGDKAAAAMLDEQTLNILRKSRIIN